MFFVSVSASDAELRRTDSRYRRAMTSDPDPRETDLTLNTGADAPMTDAQAARLKQLARDAYDLEAFSPQMTRTEAARRIATLEAKLKLQGEPPHTL
jgi:hypothetical protein